MTFNIRVMWQFLAIQFQGFYMILDIILTVEHFRNNFICVNIRFECLLVSTVSIEICLIKKRMNTIARMSTCVVNPQQPTLLKIKKKKCILVTNTLTKIIPSDATSLMFHKVYLPKNVQFSWQSSHLTFIQLHWGVTKLWFFGVCQVKFLHQIFAAALIVKTIIFGCPFCFYQTHISVKVKLTSVIFLPKALFSILVSIVTNLREIGIEELVL